MKIVQLFILILAFFIIRPVQAGVLLEPVIGYNFVKSQVNSAGSSEDSSTGPAIGGRIGYQNLGLQLGLDYLRSTLNVDASSFKEDLTINEFGGFVGFEFPILFRVYAGYIFAASGSAVVDYGSGRQDLEFNSGSGMKLGVGFTGLPFIDINFEYRNGTFDEYKLGNTKVNTSTDYRSFMIGLSLPLVL